MSDTDNRARQDSGVDSVDAELPGKTAKANPTAKTRLPEDAARATFYHSAGQKDALPEHQARRDMYPHITVLTE